MVFLSDRLHLRCGADHRMIIDCFRINVIINEKPCHIILALLDLLNDGVCVSDCKSPDFLPGIFLIFIADIQKCFVTVQHSRNLQKPSVLPIAGAQRPKNVLLRNAVQRHFAPVLPNRDIIGEHLILCVIVKEDCVLTIGVLIKIKNAVHAFFASKWNTV